MNTDLQHIEHDLEGLEASVIAEYDACKAAAAAAEPGQRVTISELTLFRLTRHLENLKSALYATGDKRKLTLVSDHHDALRIRMIGLQHLLEREIPRPYVEEALDEFSKGGYGAQGALPAAKTSPGATASLLSRVLRKSAPPAPAPAKSSRPVLTAAQRNEQCLSYLHKLMEEDRLNLLAEKERPPHIGGAAPLPTYTARFTTKDVAEVHHGQRVGNPKEQIARTPEELRAKLAKLGHFQEEKGNK